MTSLRLILFSACLLLAGISTQSFAQCGIPNGLNVTNVAFPSATLGWNAVSGATSYIINVQNASGNNTPFNVTLTSATNSITVNSFPVQGNYKFKVRTVCGGNNSNWSPTFNFTVGAGGGGGSCNNLGTPTGLNVTNIAFPSATLGWNVVAGATSYSVNVQNGSGNATPLDTTFTST
ncbi:MAG: fibronectin type III domain-containing protein, partial [Bacteroidota bacterium]